MKSSKKITRRNALWMIAVTGFAGLSSRVWAADAKKIEGMKVGKDCPMMAGMKMDHKCPEMKNMKMGDKCPSGAAHGESALKTAPDPEPLKDELKKYQRCSYCGMHRKMWNHSRHIVHYGDNTVEATCSLRCAAVSLSLNLNRGIKAIYAADSGSKEKIKPMLNVDKATYLTGSDLPGTMTKQSKMAFSSKDNAMAAQKKHGGKLADFDMALREAYLSMADDTAMIRKKRAAKMKKME